MISLERNKHGQGSIALLPDETNELCVSFVTAVDSIVDFVSSPTSNQHLGDFSPRFSKKNFLEDACETKMTEHGRSRNDTKEQVDSVFRN